jgi:DNA-binding transcriptional MocR family regulator
MRLLAEYRPAECHPPFRLLDFMREMGHERLIMLGAGVPSPELLPRKEILESMQDADERTKGGFLGYHVPEGEVDLRTHLAERLRSRGVDLPADESSVITTTGATQALHLALSEHLAPGDLVAVESPCYYNLLEQIQYFKCQVLADSERSRIGDRSGSPRIPGHAFQAQSAGGLFQPLQSHRGHHSR